jgi:hypothetical protein
MHQSIVARGSRGWVVLADSITTLGAAEAGAIVVTGSHGGRSAAEFALRVPLRLVVFNDAGVGKDGAGIAALALMEQAGVPAATVRHDSARIGDAQDAWAHGVLSHINAGAAALGLKPGARLATALAALVGPANNRTAADAP